MVPLPLPLVVVFVVTATLATDGHYSNEWVVRVVGGPKVADNVALEMGYKNLGELKGFADTYLLKKRDHPRRSRRHSEHLTKRLADDTRVVWAEQQEIRRRDKRDVGRKTPPQSEEYRFNDELWPHQWYMHDTRNMMDLPKLDMNVVPVWNMGFTGKGIVITVLDDGLEWNHTDIKANYDPKASWDTNNNSPDPFPRYDAVDSNRHGTRCAGEIAMEANNDKCGVGVAYNAKIGGIKMLDGDVSDAVESVSLAHSIDHVDIFSASWGPTDDGMTLDGPKRLAIEALEKGIYQGREGKGVIYVWASGNGGGSHDNCNCDGYTSSVYTLSIGSASQHGQFPWYGERCASTTATTFSSGAYRDQKISTTDLHNKCTIDHTGTSAAAPLAAGVVALLLEANPKLTWRDVQHLVVWTSDYEPLQNNKGWKRNSAGLLYNSRFGFGLMNAHSLIERGIKWKTVPPKTTCLVPSLNNFPLKLKSGTATTVNFVTDGCEGTEGEINFLEHVEVTVDIEYPRRGVLDVFLISPAGSMSMLLSRREFDTSQLGFRNWTFMTVHLWAENPRGDWKILIRDEKGIGLEGKINGAKLILHGTRDKPAHLVDGPKKYSHEDNVKRVIDPRMEYDEEDAREVPDEVKSRLKDLREKLINQYVKYRNDETPFQNELTNIRTSDNAYHYGDEEYIN